MSTRDELQIDPARLADWLQSDPALQVIDVREPHERDAGHLEGSRHIELNRLTEEAASVDRERAVIFYCRVGSRSTLAAEAFRTAGFEAYSLQGGLLRWADEGGALTPRDGTVAEH